MTATDDARLLEIEARERAATAGPWEVWGGCDAVHPVPWDDDPAIAADIPAPSDAQFIAHSREDVRFLLDRLKAAESRIRELEGAVEGERYYWMVDKHGSVAMMPAVTVEEG